MHIPQFLNPLALGTHIEVVISCLPEVRLPSNESPGYDFFTACKPRANVLRSG
jgi:hypothetical protein